MQAHGLSAVVVTGVDAGGATPAFLKEHGGAEVLAVTTLVPLAGAAGVSIPVVCYPCVQREADAGAASAADGGGGGPGTLLALLSTERKADGEPVNTPGAKKRGATRHTQDTDTTSTADTRQTQHKSSKRDGNAESEEKRLTKGDGGLRKSNEQAPQKEKAKHRLLFMTTAR